MTGGAGGATRAEDGAARAGGTGSQATHRSLITLIRTVSGRSSSGRRFLIGPIAATTRSARQHCAHLVRLSSSCPVSSWLNRSEKVVLVIAKHFCSSQFHKVTIFCSFLLSVSLSLSLPLPSSRLSLPSSPSHPLSSLFLSLDLPLPLPLSLYLTVSLSFFLPPFSLHLSSSRVLAASLPPCLPLSPPLLVSPSFPLFSNFRSNLPVLFVQCSFFIVVKLIAKKCRV